LESLNISNLHSKEVLKSRGFTISREVKNVSVFAKKTASLKFTTHHPYSMCMQTVESVTYCIFYKNFELYKAGWCGVENAHLSPVWPRFDPRLLTFGSECLSLYSLGFPTKKKKNFSRLRFDQHNKPTWKSARVDCNFSSHCANLIIVFFFICKQQINYIQSLMEIKRAQSLLLFLGI